MKRLFFIIFLFISLAGYSQDIKPVDPIRFKALQTPSWYYYTLDSSVWMYKGATYGWTELATTHWVKDTLKYYEPVITPPDVSDPWNYYWNGEKHFAPISMGSGGYAANIYFTTKTSTIYTSYKEFNYIPEAITTTLTGTVTNQELLVRTYLAPQALETALIDAGEWSFYLKYSVSNAVGITQIKFEPFLRHSNGTETTLFSFYTDELNSTDITGIKTLKQLQSYSCTATDYLGVRIYFKTTSLAAITIYTLVGDGDASYFNTPLKLRHSQLRDLNWALNLVTNSGSGHTGTPNSLATFDAGGLATCTTTGNLTESIAGLEFNSTRQVIGGAADLRLTTGYAIPTTSSLASYDSHLSNTSNPHNVTKTQIGLGNVTDDAQVKRTEMGVANGVATLDAGAKVPYSQLPASLMIYKGVWSPLTNTPTLADGTGTAGWVYKANLSGSCDFGHGSISFYAGDWVIYNGSTWERSVGTDNVVSVNGQQGIVSLNTSHIPENTNLYYTDTRSRSAISLGTTGNSGAATYNSSTGAFNIPNYTLAGLGGEPAFSKNTAFNKNFGTTSGTVLEGRTFGTAANNNTGDFLSSSVNPYNISMTFNPSTKELGVTDAGGTKSATINITSGNIVNSFTNTASVTTTTTVVTFPTSMTYSNYPLYFWCKYHKTINGKDVLIDNAVYDFTKTINGFSFSVDTIAGTYFYLATDTTNIYPISVDNYIGVDAITTSVGTPGSDLKIPTEKAVRTAIAGVNPMVYPPTAGITLFNGSTWSPSITDNHLNWDKYNQWDGGSTGLTPATGRASLGGTTIGQNLFTLTNPSAITFPRFNADNTVSVLNAADFRTAIGAGTGNGTMTSVVSDTSPNLGGNLIVNQKNIDVSATLSSNSTYSGIIETGTVGENVTFGDVLYLKFSDGKWWKAKANSYSTTPAVRMALALTSANSSGPLLIEGNIRYDSWSFAGNKIYLSESTAGAITTTQPSTTGNQIQVIGIAKTSTTMYFKPSQDVGEK